MRDTVAHASVREWTAADAEFVDNVRCVACPDCAFVFDADHELHNRPGVYSCPNCFEAASAALADAPAAVPVPEPAPPLLDIDVDCNVFPGEVAPEKNDSGAPDGKALLNAVDEAVRELRFRASLTNAHGQVEPPYTAMSLNALADLLERAREGASVAASVLEQAPPEADPTVGLSESAPDGGAKRYRKRPVVIEAMRYTGANGGAVRRWIGESFVRWGAEPLIRLRTLEGIVTVSPGDWVIRGVRGEFYPCKPDIFAATYDPAPAPEGTVSGASVVAPLGEGEVAAAKSAQDADVAPGGGVDS